MRFPSFLFAITFVLAVSISATAQEPQRRDPQAIAVLARSISAMGGVPGSLPVNDVVITAEVTGASEEPRTRRTVEIRAKGPDRFRADSTVDGEQRSYVVRRGIALAGRGNILSPKPTLTGELKRPEFLPLLMVAAEYLRPDVSMQYLAQEIVLGQPVHRIALQRVYRRQAELDAILSEASRLEVFVDTVTYAVAGISYLARSETDWRHTYPVELRYSDYRRVGGLWVPFECKQFVMGQLAWSLRIQTIDFNRGISDSVFELR